MRNHRAHRPFAPSVLLTLAATVAAQDPAPPASAAAEPPAASAEGPRRARRATLVLEAAVVHPVHGPAIQDGVVVIRGERIVAVGKRGEVEVPPNATVRAFPNGHLYPGLIDAATDAFTDGDLRSNQGLDLGMPLALDLEPSRTADDGLAAAGITTAYVTVRSPSVQRGQGALVRCKDGGFEVWRGKEQAGAQLRFTNGPGATHALARQQQLDGMLNLFEGVEEYRKAKQDHADAVAKYQKDFEAYLAYHQKKKDGDKPKEGDKPANAPGTGTPANTAPAGESPTPGPRRGPGGRRGNGGGDEPPRPNGGDLELLLVEVMDLLAQDPPRPTPPTPTPPTPTPPRQDPPAGGQPQGAQPPGSQAPAAGSNPPNRAAETKDEAPKRPAYPKAPAVDPVKEALLAVLDGTLPLRIEAHRPDEVRAALELQRAQQVPTLVLEQAYGAADEADRIAAQGASVVLTEVLPDSLPEIYADFDVTALPAKLQSAGVPFAIATGSARRAAWLPLMAATAVGRGLTADAALRAITLTPAEILGIAKDTGSLQAGKYADVLVTDRPLFASDSRVLLVLGRGTPEYEAK